jgi:hypothetical protein
MERNVVSGYGQGPLDIGVNGAGENGPEPPVFQSRSEVVHLIAPSETARTGVFGISMNVWPGPTFVGVQPTCVMSNVPALT